MSSGSLHGYAAPSPRWARRLVGGLAVAVLVALTLVVVQLLRSVPTVSASAVLPGKVRVGGRPPRLPWPSQGSAAVEVLGVGSLGSFRGNRVTPLASLTKLMTALVILKKHPLRPAASGPTISISAAEVAAYKAELASAQSVVEVRTGERLDERQALEGLLVGSANNIAQILASWDAGSTAAFVAQMNALAASLGLRHTQFVEPSGLAAGNLGTATEMTRLGADALANQTIASIVRLGEVKLPVAGVVINYDYALGHHGIIGIKTGSSNAAGGNFVFAARRTIGGRTLTVVGAVLHQEGASQLESALTAGERLAAAALADVRSFSVLHSGTTALRVQAAWASKPSLGRTAGAVHYLGIPGTEAKLRTLLAAPFSHDHPRQVRRGERLGTVTIEIGRHTYAVPIIASASLPGPSIRYRLTRL